MPAETEPDSSAPACPPMFDGLVISESTSDTAKQHLLLAKLGQLHAEHRQLIEQNQLRQCLNSRLTADLQKERENLTETEALLQQIDALLAWAIQNADTLESRVSAAELRLKEHHNSEIHLRLMDVRAKVAEKVEEIEQFKRCESQSVE
eukprot:SAG31_NODE_4913_length_2871_cov_2.230159_1_plen_149_part_00